MSTEITTAFVKQFGSNIYTLAQQKGSRLRKCVRTESVKGDARYFDRIGSVTAAAYTTRHGDTPLTDTPHSRRRLTLVFYKHADLIDEDDKVRMLIDPTSDYVMSFVWAMGRAIDDNIIAAHGGSAYSGVAGATEVTLPNANKLASVSSGAGSKLNVQALRRAKKMLDQGEVDPSITRYIAPSAVQMENLLSQTEVTSSDFNTVKALVQGELNTFLGFNFVRQERNLTQSGTLSFDQTTGAVGSGSGDADTYEKVPAWAEDGLILGIGSDIQARVSERSDKNYSMQAFASMGIGATRMEEAKVVQILCVAS